MARLVVSRTYRAPLPQPIDPISPDQITPPSLTDSLSFSQIFSTVIPSPSPTPHLTIDDIPDIHLADTLALIFTEFCNSPRTASHVLPHPADPAALFYSPYREKSFSLSFYCRRLLEHNHCSKSCYAVAILYLLRLAERFPIFELNDYNVHRLVLTAVVLAVKWSDDLPYSNRHYAKVGGIQSAVEMTRLETHMLKCLDYRLYVSKESFQEVEAYLIQTALNPK